ncbi:hypothetical protein ON010_g6885 [Phytophthora cinnamomi]|nr:hypothetical protein ON010_g6885 [Phytophthora cinnamomi]
MPPLYPRQRRTRNFNCRLDGSFWQLRPNRELSVRENTNQGRKLGGGLLEQRHQGESTALDSSLATTVLAVVVEKICAKRWDNTSVLTHRLLSDSEGHFTEIGHSASEGAALICRWHMNKTMISKTGQIPVQVAIENTAPGQSKFENTWQTDCSLEAFYSTADAGTEDAFDEKRAKLKR